MEEFNQRPLFASRFVKPETWTICELRINSSHTAKVRPQLFSPSDKSEGGGSLSGGSLLSCRLQQVSEFVPLDNIAYFLFIFFIFYFFGGREIKHVLYLSDHHRIHRTRSHMHTHSLSLSRFPQTPELARNKNTSFFFLSSFRRPPAVLITLPRLRL